MSDDLVANDINDYFNKASRLAKDREYAYHIRVKLLEAVDGKAAAEIHNRVARKQAIEQAKREGRGQSEDADDDDDDEDNTNEHISWSNELSSSYSHQDSKAGMDSELREFLERVGRPWANERG